jgi:hypothetical protein
VATDLWPGSVIGTNKAGCAAFEVVGTKYELTRQGRHPERYARTQCLVTEPDQANHWIEHTCMTALTTAALRAIDAMSEPKLGDQVRKDLG